MADELREWRALSRLLTGVRARREQRADEIATRLSAQLAAGHAEALLEYWAAEGVVALAVSRAAELGVREAAWDEAAGELGAFAQARIGLQELAIMQLTRALAKEGIASVALKGPPLARRLYGDPALRRPSGDIDLLVPADALDHASEVVQRLGWQPPADPRFANARPDLHLAHRGRDGLPAVEIHWRVQWYEAEEHSRGLLERAVRVDGLPVLAPIDLLSMLLLCVARDGFHGQRLSADVAAWWDRYGDDQGEAPTSLFAGLLGRPHAAAAYALARTMGTPAPPIDGGMPARRRSWVERVALADRPATPRTTYAQVAVVDVLVAPPGLARRRLATNWFRSPEFLAASHAELSARVPTGVLRAASFLRTLARVPLFAWRARRECGAP